MQSDRNPGNQTVRQCVIFGGAGYIGTHLAKRFLETGRFDRVHLADIRPSPLEGQPGVSYSRTDVRLEIPRDLVRYKPEWIFNLAAVHREPGHEAYEYFATNLPGARNVCQYAEDTGCENIYFTSSISVYGPTDGPTSESSPTKPTTPYGGSKLPAELIHEGWFRAERNRRLVICRPGVVYGPGDPGNILRMIRAVKKGYFAYPGSPSIFKSYAYIYGLLDSVEFLMDRPELNYVVHNYVETPTEPLAQLVEITKKFLNCRAVVLPIPLWILLPIAHAVQALFGKANPVHPVRVRKAATPTYIVPQTLIDLDFDFRYTFAESLEHWQQISPGDFNSAAAASEGARSLHLIAPALSKQPNALQDKKSTSIVSSTESSTKSE